MSASFVTSPGVGFASEPAAADGAASEREVETRFLELGQDGLLDLIERHRPAGGVPRRLLEGAGNLPDARGGKRAAASVNRVVIDDGLEHERVVGIDPERHFLTG
jgi:hypothetical protein